MTFLSLMLLLSFSSVMAVQPFGASVTETRTESSVADSPDSHDAFAGNVTEFDIFGYSITQAWQGYFGNVTGTIQLADSSDNVMYNWSLASPEGEIYAVNSSVVSWANVECFNFTSDTELNLSQLEESFNIASDDVDGVDETFALLGAGSHDSFYTNSIEFTEGQCPNTRIYDNSGSGTDGSFEELLMYDPSNNALIFTSILDEDVLGFDAGTHDFQMIVLEDGHGTNLVGTNYYFYVELE